MDREAAFRQLCDYWSQVREAQKLPRFAGQRDPALAALNQQLAVINRILRELVPRQAMFARVVMRCSRSS